MSREALVAELTGYLANRRPCGGRENGEGCEASPTWVLLWDCSCGKTHRGGACERHAEKIRRAGRANSIGKCSGRMMLSSIEPFEVEKS